MDHIFHYYIGMKDKMVAPPKCSISNIVRISVEEDGGLLGFTITYSEYRFENVVMSYLPVNQDVIMAELNNKRKELIRKMNKEGMTK